MKCTLISVIIFCVISMFAGQATFASDPDEIPISFGDEQEIKKIAPPPDPAVVWKLKEYADMDMDSQFQALIPLFQEEYKAKRDLFLTQDRTKLIAFLKSKLQNKTSTSRERFQANILLERIEKKEEIEHYYDRREMTKEEKKKESESLFLRFPRYYSSAGGGELIEVNPNIISYQQMFQEKKTTLVYYLLEKLWKTPDVYEAKNRRHEIKDKQRSKENFKSGMRAGEKLEISFMFQKTVVPQKIEELKICAEDHFIGDKDVYYSNTYSIIETVLLELACYYNWRECYPKLYKLAENDQRFPYEANWLFLTFRATKEDIPYLQNVAKQNHRWKTSAEMIITALNNGTFHPDLILKESPNLTDLLYGQCIAIQYLPTLPEMKSLMDAYHKKMKEQELRYRSAREAGLKALQKAREAEEQKQENIQNP